MPTLRESATAALLARARQGDRSAIGELLGRHRERLLQMVAVRMDERLAPRIDPSDVVQEAMTDASRRLPEYLQTQPVPFYAWLRQIAWDRLIDLHRRHICADKRSVRREEPLGISDTSAMQLAERILASGLSPLTRLVREELHAQVRKCLARLAADDREILILRHLEQLSSAETAAVLEIGEEAAIQRHVRALRRLRRLLEGAARE